MSQRPPRVLIQNYGVIADAIHGNVSVVGAAAGRPQAPTEATGGHHHPSASLRGLLESLFNPQTLQRFLYVWPEYRAAALEIPIPPAPVGEILFQAEQVLRRHGLLNEVFADRLSAYFPAREVDIRRSARDW